MTGVLCALSRYKVINTSSLCSLSLWFNANLGTGEQGWWNRLRLCLVRTGCKSMATAFWILASHVGLDGKCSEITKVEGWAESIQHSAAQCRPTRSNEGRHHPSHLLEMSRLGWDQWCPRSFLFSAVTIKRAGWLPWMQTPTLRVGDTRCEEPNPDRSARSAFQLCCREHLAWLLLLNNSGLLSVPCNLRWGWKLFSPGYGHNCDFTCGYLPWWVSCDSFVRNSSKRIGFCAFLL